VGPGFWSWSHVSSLTSPEDWSCSSVVKHAQGPGFSSQCHKTTTTTTNYLPKPQIPSCTIEMIIPSSWGTVRTEWDNSCKVPTAVSGTWQTFNSSFPLQLYHAKKRSTFQPQLCLLPPYAFRSCVRGDLPGHYECFAENTLLAFRVVRQKVTWKGMNFNEFHSIIESKVDIHHSSTIILLSTIIGWVLTFLLCEFSLTT
jgi:hypothetical protein